MIATEHASEETAAARTNASARSSQPLLKVTDLAVRFGGIVALDGVTFQVERGRITGVIGPNGAGKTTLFNCLSRLYPWQRGSIEFNGVSLGEVPRHRMAELGIGRTFQNLALFRSMSVRQNIMVGAHSRSRGGYLANVLRLPFVAREEARVDAHARELMALMDLLPLAEKRVSDLPFGLQKRVELARALAARPSLLLLDEPAAGLNHEEVETFMSLIRRMRDEFALTILLVEHHMNLVMRVSDQVVVLNFGRKIADGTPEEVRLDSEVIRAYLGAAA